MQQSAPQLIPGDKPSLANEILSYSDGDKLTTVTVRFGFAEEMRFAIRGEKFTGEYVNGTKIQWLGDWFPVWTLEKVFAVWGCDTTREVTVLRGATFYRAADMGMFFDSGELSVEEVSEPDVDLLAYTGTDHVYFVQAESLGRIKIGTSSNVASRIGALRTASPDKLLVLGLIRGDCTVERALHQKFAADRLHGEWFTPSDRLLAYIKEVAQ